MTRSLVKPNISKAPLKLRRIPSLMFNNTLLMAHGMNRKIPDMLLFLNKIKNYFQEESLQKPGWSSKAWLILLKLETLGNAKVIT